MRAHLKAFLTLTRSSQDEDLAQAIALSMSSRSESSFRYGAWELESLGTRCFWPLPP